MEAIFEFLKNNTDTANALIGICALGMSFLSIALGFVAFFAQRQHNFKSLTPIAEIRFHDYEDNVAIRIANVGIGPLLIEKFVASSGNEVHQNLISWMPEPPSELAWDTYYEHIDGITIRPNEEAAILRLVNSEADQVEYEKFREKIRKILATLNLTVTYRDIYDRRMPLAKRSLEWFGRQKPKQKNTR